MILPVLLSLAAAAVALLVLIRFSLDGMMFYPSPGLTVEPADFGLDAEEVLFSAPDGSSLHGWHFPRPGSKAVLLFLHGNAGNIGHRLPLVRQLQRAPVDLFLFDYRGYGRSGGKSRGEGLLDDARAALEALRSRPETAGRKVVLFGESIGGSTALLLASREKVDGVISMAAFTSIRGVARDMPVFGLFSLLVPRYYDALGALPGVKVPLLFVHGTDDEVIPFAHGRRLFRAAAGEKRRLWIKGGRHNDLFETAGIEIVREVESFVASLPGPGGRDVED